MQMKSTLTCAFKYLNKTWIIQRTQTQKEEEHFCLQPQSPQRSTQVSVSPGATMLQPLNGWALLSLLHVIKSLMSSFCGCAPPKDKRPPPLSAVCGGPNCCYGNTRASHAELTTAKCGRVGIWEKSAAEGKS